MLAQQLPNILSIFIMFNDASSVRNKILILIILKPIRHMYPVICKVIGELFHFGDKLYIIYYI